MATAEIKPAVNRAEFLRKLNSLDFGPLVYKLMHAEDRPGLSLEQAVDAVEKYKGFLFLYYTNPGKPLSPSGYVDYVWHTHIMDTQLYMTQCLYLFGHYLHHFPFFGQRGERDQQELLAAAELTKSLAAKELGWDEDDWCGTRPRPKWPKPHRSYIADLCAVLYPAGALAQQLSGTKETITIETGSFRQTIEHVGPATTDLLNVSEQPASYPTPAKPRMAGLAERAERMDYAISAVKLPRKITVCMPVVDRGIEIARDARPAELLEKAKALSEQRLQPEGFTSSMVSLDVHAG